MARFFFHLICSGTYGLTCVFLSNFFCLLKLIKLVRCNGLNRYHWNWWFEIPKMSNYGYCIKCTNGTSSLPRPFFVCLVHFSLWIIANEQLRSIYRPTKNIIYFGMNQLNDGGDDVRYYLIFCRAFFSFDWMAPVKTVSLCVCVFNLLIDWNMQCQCDANGKSISVAKLFKVQFDRNWIASVWIDFLFAKHRNYSHLARTALKMDLGVSKYKKNNHNEEKKHISTAKCNS